VPGVHPELAATLQAVLEATDKAARRERDPVRFAHRYDHPQDIELVGLLAASLAFGNVTTILAKVQEVLDRLGGLPRLRTTKLASLEARLGGFVHRLYTGDDVARLLFGAAEVQRREGSLGAVFEQTLRRAERAPRTGDEPAARQAAGALVDAIRRHGGFGLDQTTSPEGAPVARSRGAAHLLPDPLSASACKRLHLFLRWMVRPADGIDLGLWSGVSTSILTMPLDVHIQRISRNLALTSRSDVSYRTARSITDTLALIDPLDPVRFDFALCHLGMVGSCLSERDDVACLGCGVKPVCRHWPRERSAWPRKRPSQRDERAVADASLGPKAADPHHDDS
jgi:uncharacterized protein (TIGR02757 family)